jgi:hypothetical protein
VFREHLEVALEQIWRHVAIVVGERDDISAGSEPAGVPRPSKPTDWHAKQFTRPAGKGLRLCENRRRLVSRRTVDNDDFRVPRQTELGQMGKERTQPLTAIMGTDNQTHRRCRHYFVP